MLGKGRRGRIAPAVLASPVLFPGAVVASPERPPGLALPRRVSDAGGIPARSRPSGRRLPGLGLGTGRRTRPRPPESRLLPVARGGASPKGAREQEVSSGAWRRGDLRPRPSGGAGLPRPGVRCTPLCPVGRALGGGCSTVGLTQGRPGCGGRIETLVPLKRLPSPAQPSPGHLGAGGVSAAAELEPDQTGAGRLSSGDLRGGVT